MEKVENLAESFMDFLKSSEELQKADIEAQQTFGANPNVKGPSVSIIHRLEQLESIIFAAKNKLDNVREEEVSPYITNKLDKAYLELREAYLRLMDMDK
tara:strand:- start:75 stop:371 length:297 start_codon:yes stop_codon:yes gene_type:complete